MMRAMVIATFGFCMAVGGLALQASDEKNPEAIEKQVQEESNPRKRANLVRDLLKLRLDRLHSRIATGNMLESSSPELANYQIALEWLGTAVQKADHIGTSKSAEQLLRDQIYDLNDYKMSLSAAERPYLERIIARAVKLRQQILYGLMHPPVESKNQKEKGESLRQ